MMKRALQLALVAALVASLAAPVAATDLSSFLSGFENLTSEQQAAIYYNSGSQTTTEEVEVDTSFLEGASDWAEEEILYAYQQGLLNGMDSLLSDYDTSITRKEFCQLVVNAYLNMGGYRISTMNPFTDTYDADVITAYALGIVTGTTETTFDPDATITREDLAVMLYRAVKIFVVTTVSGDISSYTDVDEISGYALDAVTYMNQIGVMNGYSATEMAPKEQVTREQAILMAYRTLQNYK